MKRSQRIIPVIVSAIIVVLSSIYPVNAEVKVQVAKFENDNEIDTSSSTDVIQLTSRDFDSKVGSGGVWLIEFYADWCGHCKRFSSTYQLIAQNLHKKNKDKSKSKHIHVAKIEGSQERILSSRFSIRGYPTFFVVDGWDVYEFKGIRTLESLMNFVEKDYRKQEPLRFYNSPFGPIGQTRSLVMKIGTFVLGQYESLTKQKSLSPVIATMLLAGVGIVVGTFIILVFGLLLVYKQKTD